jgi:hypothetical protein
MARKTNRVEEAGIDLDRAVERILHRYDLTHIELMGLLLRQFDTSRRANDELVHRVELYLETLRKK